MNTAHAILTVALGISLSGCLTQSKPKVTTPPAPQPAPAPVAAAPAPPPQPLSMPQTQIQLPPEQPVDLEALAMAPTAEVHVEPPAPARTTRSRPKPTPPPAAAPEPASPPPIPSVATSPDTTERGVVSEVLPQAEKVRLKNSADTHKREVLRWLNGASGRRLDPSNPTVVRIKSLLTDSDEAEAKGDLRKASDFADRAVTLLRELQSGR